MYSSDVSYVSQWQSPEGRQKGNVFADRGPATLATSLIGELTDPVVSTHSAQILELLW
jgi:hypothetical protein